MITAEKKFKKLSGVLNILIQQAFVQQHGLNCYKNKLSQFSVFFYLYRHAARVHVGRDDYDQTMHHNSFLFMEDRSKRA